MSDFPGPEFVLQAAGVLVGQAPVLLACVVGIALAAIRWKHHPRTSLLLVFGFSVLLLVPLFSALVSVAVFPVIYREMGTDKLRVVMPFLSAGTSLFAACGYLLLLWAALARRRS